MKRYYRVEVLAGHCAHINDSDTLTFFFYAKDIMSAMRMALHMPGVKHNNTKAIQSVYEIDESEYLRGRNISAYEIRNNPIIYSDRRI